MYSFKCTQHQHLFNQLAILAMPLHGICLFSTFYTSLLVWGGGGEVPCNLTQVVYDTPKGTLVSKETIQPSTNLHSWIVENLIHQVFQTHFSIPFHVFPTTLSLWKTNSPRRKKTMSQTCELNMKMCLHFQ